MNTRRAMVIIGWATLLAGGLDFTFATLSFFFSGGSVAKLWQFVASGIFGRAAYSMGTVGILCGVLFHFSIMAIFSTFIFLVYGKISAVEKWPVLAGLVYGICIWLVMNLLVVPLSRAGNGLITLKFSSIMNADFVVHMLLGVVLVLVMRQSLHRELSPAAH